jgi:AraC-like DNA-binding protein
VFGVHGSEIADAQLTLFWILPTSMKLPVAAEDDSMMRRFDARSRNHIAMGPSLPEVQAHRALLQASAVVRVELCERFQEILPRELVPLVAHAMAVPDVSLHRDAAAQHLGLSRRTLHRRLILAGWPAPRRFLSSLRLLVAAGLLDRGIPSLDHIAWYLGFSDGIVLGKALRQLSGSTVSSLRAHGALSPCLARLRTVQTSAPTPSPQ